jgi:dihydroneopterin aldolase
VDASAASAADRIDQTVDYAQVVQDLRDCLFDRRHFLVEALADFVAQRLLAEFAAHRVRVAVAKQAVLEGVASVGVEVERFRC